MYLSPSFGACHFELYLAFSWASYYLPRSACGKPQSDRTYLCPACVCHVVHCTFLTTSSGMFRGPLVAEDLHRLVVALVKASSTEKE